VGMAILVPVEGILLSIMVRAVRGTWAAASRRTASRDATAYLYRARSIAIQQSRAASVVRSANVLKIMVDSSGTPVQLGTQLDFSQRYGATLGASPKDTIQFDPRGFGGNVTQTRKLIVDVRGRT